jgi:hypothetical protein
MIVMWLARDAVGFYLRLSYKNSYYYYEQALDDPNAIDLSSLKWETLDKSKNLNNILLSTAIFDEVNKPIFGNEDFRMDPFFL